jgi:beta-glucosidase
LPAQPIALAASFDRRLVRDVAAAIGSELRGASNAAEARGQGPRATNAFAPNINLFRDARWGRGSETFGEDPELTGRLAVEYVRCEAAQQGPARMLL